MGFAISWLAIKGLPASTVVQSLGLNSTGEFDELPDAPICGCDLKNGWYVIFTQKFAHEFISDKTLQSLSSNTEIVAVGIEEHVMCDSASFWKNGQREWFVMHDAQKGIEHLINTGNLPEAFSAIRDKYFKQQEDEGGQSAGVDYIFEIPTVLALSLTGFKHDECGNFSFETLAQAKKPAKGGFLGRIFS